jgi:cyclopropane-fatty-acyl-phospholipid synthase
MNDTVLNPAVRATAGMSVSLAQSFARRAVLHRLSGLRQGGLMIECAGERLHFGHAPPEITVHVHDPAFWPRVAFGGSVGAGESYMDGDWSSDNLTGLLRLLLRNRAVLDGMEARSGASVGAAARSVGGAAAQYPRRQSAQHRRALRPGQRFLPALAGSDA